MTTRRELLTTLGGLALTAQLAARAGALHAASKDRAPDALATDEDFWAEVQRAFPVDRTVINLNNGGVSPAPQVVMESLHRYLDTSNLAPAWSMWRVLEPQIEAVRARLAGHFGCDPEELAITRNASESLEILLSGYPLVAGDEVLTTTHDYPRMLTTLDQRARREGIVVRKVPVPSPPKRWEELAELIVSSLSERTKLVHMSHIVNITGQIFPVRAVVRACRERGVSVVVDGAHAFAQFPFTRDELDCDFYGTSLHKWLHAPIGTGFLYVRRARIREIWPLMAAPPELDDNIRKFEEIGTHPAANHHAIADALTFLEGIGLPRKAARLRYLRARWEDRLRGRAGVTLRTDPVQSCAIANVHLAGRDPGRLADWFWDKHRILVTPIGHPECPGLRITPSIYTTLGEIDRFSAAMEQALADPSVGV